MVSERKGDKARFGRERKKENLPRKRIRGLWEELGLEVIITRTASAESKYGFGFDAAGDPGRRHYR